MKKIFSMVALLTAVVTGPVGAVDIHVFSQNDESKIHDAMDNRVENFTIKVGAGDARQITVGAVQEEIYKKWKAKDIQDPGIEGTPLPESFKDIFIDLEGTSTDDPKVLIDVEGLSFDRTHGGKVYKIEYRVETESRPAK